MSGSKQLETLEAYREDVGLGVARIDETTANGIGVAEGEVISITGSRRTFAKCKLLQSNDAGPRIARFDGIIRNNAGAHIGDLVEVRRAIFTPAEAVEITPLEPVPPIDERYFTDAFEGHPMAVGDNVLIPYFGESLSYQVVGVKPEADVVMPRRATTFSVVQKLKFPGYAYVGGLANQVMWLRERIELPLLHPEIYEKLGAQAPQCVLLAGETGVGKTHLMKAISNELQNDERTKSQRLLWADAANATSKIDEFRKHLGSKIDAAGIYDILFIDDVDLVLKHDDGSVLRILISMIDNLDRNKRIVAAARSPETIEPALRRRFSEIVLSAPNVAGRLEILQIYSRHMPFSQDINLRQIAEMMGNLVGADIERLCSEAGVLAVRRWVQALPREIARISPELLDRLQVTMEDFAEAAKVFKSKADA